MVGGNRDGAGQTVEIAVGGVDETNVTIGNRRGRSLETGDVLAHRTRQEIGVDGRPGDQERRAKNPAARSEPYPHQRDKAQSDRYPDKERKTETTLHELPLGTVLSCQFSVVSLSVLSFTAVAELKTENGERTTVFRRVQPAESQ